MEQRDAIFRDRLIELMTALNSGAGEDANLRRIVGSYAYRMARDGGAVGWQDLKARVNAASYDSLLRLFQEQSAEFARQGNTVGVMALEALGLSLIARFQTSQPDLLPGVGFLDRYIERCASAFGRSGAPGTSRPAPH